MDKPDPTSQYKHLVRHFFGRFFDLDAIVSPQIDPVEKHILLFQILALLLLPGVLKCLFMFPEYAYYIYRPILERDVAPGASCYCRPGGCRHFIHFELCDVLSKVHVQKY